VGRRPSASKEKPFFVFSGCCQNSRQDFGKGSEHPPHPLPLGLEISDTHVSALRIHSFAISQETKRGGALRIAR